MDDDRDTQGQPDAKGRVQYGGGHQEGGGMIEPDEFADGGTDVLDEEPDHPGGRNQPTSPQEPAEGADPPR